MTGVIPKIKSIEEQEGFLDAGNGFSFSFNLSGFDDYCIKTFQSRTKSVDGGNKITLAKNDSLQEEGYKLKVQTNEISIEASGNHGVINALTTLFLMIDKGGKLQCASIEDCPRLSHRGLHIDVSRHFFCIEELKKIVEEISLVKMNRLHLHLSDDQGFRLQIDKYPKLYQQCGDEYYTKEQIKELVEFAKLRGVTIIPEFDMPGHTRSFTAAYPDLSCTGEAVELAKYGGIYPVILCPGKEETFEFLENLWDEIIPLFDSDVIHIGGDEAPKTRWVECPCCQRRMADEDLHSENELQGYFTKRLSDYIKRKYDKKIICWNDSLEVESFLDSDDTVQYWSLEHKDTFGDFIGRGGRFIYSDMFELYYDYPAAMSPMKRSFLAKPVIKQIDYSSSNSFIGMEACTWTEYVDTNVKLENRIFPRIYALAENAWSETTVEGYKDFTNRLKEFKAHSRVNWGSGDPKGIKKQVEKLGFIKTMSSGMPEDVREQTIGAAAMSDEFMATFKEKMLK